MATSIIDEQESCVRSLASNNPPPNAKTSSKPPSAGQLVPQDPNDEPASVLLERIRAERAEREKQPKVRKTKQQKEIAAMVSKLIDVLAEAGDWVPAQEAFRRCGVADGAQTDQIEALYAELRALDKAGRLAVEAVTDAQGRKLHDRLKLLASLTMRLDKLTIGSAKDSPTHQFKNLKNVTIDFDQDHWVTVVIGWNGTGKSNVLEALAIIFRDLIAQEAHAEPLPFSWHTAWARARTFVTFTSTLIRIVKRIRFSFTSQTARQIKQDDRFTAYLDFDGRCRHVASWQADQVADLLERDT